MHRHLNKDFTLLSTPATAHTHGQILKDELTNQSARFALANDIKANFVLDQLCSLGKYSFSLLPLRFQSRLTRLLWFSLNQVVLTSSTPWLSVLRFCSLLSYVA